MRKFLVMAAIFVGLGFVPAAQAQYSNPNETECNAQYSHGLPQGTYSMVVNFNPHYQITGTAADIAADEANFVQVVNENIRAQYPSSRLTFIPTTDEKNFNLKTNVDIYDNNGTYSIFVEVRGLGVGHLFRYSESGTDLVGVAVQVLSEFPSYVVNGYTCGGHAALFTSSLPNAIKATYKQNGPQAATVPDAAVGKWYGLSCDKSSGSMEAVYVAMTVNSDATAVITEISAPEGDRTDPLNGTVVEAAQEIDIAFPASGPGVPNMVLQLEQGTYEGSPALEGEAVFTDPTDTSVAPVIDPIAFLPATGTISDFEAKHPASTCGTANK